MIRDALARIINQDPSFAVVGTAATPDGMLDVVRQHKPSVVVLDVRLGVSSGIEIARQVRQHHPRSRIVMLTAFPTDEALVGSHGAGAVAFLPKSGTTDQLIATLKAAASGANLIEPADVKAASQRLADAGLAEVSSLDATDRRIAERIAQGWSDKQIAADVYLSLQTVRNRVSRLLSRFDKDNRTQLALMFAGLNGGVASTDGSPGALPGSVAH
jgi:DNA-binding NarL/FixJ family response regulator